MDPLSCPVSNLLELLHSTLRPQKCTLQISEQSFVHPRAFITKALSMPAPVQGILAPRNAFYLGFLGVLFSLPEAALVFVAAFLKHVGEATLRHSSLGSPTCVCDTIIP